MITENYIKMCGKAEEIQKNLLGSGDFYAYYDEVWESVAFDTKKLKTGFKVGVYYEILRGQESDELNLYLNRKDSHKGILIWLPRQDQLQEMVKTDEVTPELAVCDHLFHFVFWVKECSYPFTSMEQLWLAFVMKEKYNKAWDGENWVKEK